MLREPYARVLYLPGDDTAAAAAAAAAAEEDVDDDDDDDGGDDDRVAVPIAAGGGDSDPLDSAPLSDALELIPSVSWKQTKHVFFYKYNFFFFCFNYIFSLSFQYDVAQWIRVGTYNISWKRK